MNSEQRSPTERIQSSNDGKSQSFQLTNERKQIKTRHLKSSSKFQTSNYYWSNRENKSYLRFLREKGFMLTLSTNQRKKIKTNLKLSKYIKTRTPTQCHTHHQKMMAKYGTIQRIITELTQIFGVSTLENPQLDNTDNPHIINHNQIDISQIKKEPIQDTDKNKIESDQARILKEEMDLEYIYY